MSSAASAIAHCWSEHLRIGAQTWPSAGSYALVDWGTVGRGPAAWTAQSRAINLFEGTPDATHASMAPLLIPVVPGPAVAPMLERLACLEAEDPCVHWLWTHESAAALTPRLQSLFLGELATGGRALIRYYDRAIWHFLGDMLDTEQQARFFGPMLAWSTLHGTVWRTHTGRDRQSSVVHASPLVWSASQVRQINLAALPLQLFEDLKDDHPDKLTNRSRRDVELLFASAIQRADALGVKTYRDFMLFALLALTVRSDFDAHAQVQEQLQRFKMGHCSLNEAIDAVPLAAWTHMGAQTRAEMI